MKNFINFTVTLSILSTILFACAGSTTTALTRAGGAATGVCASNTDCPSGQTCNVAWGTCMSNSTDLCAGVTCTVSGQTCNAATGICVTNAGCASTSGSITCSTGQYCEQDPASANYGSCQTPKANGQPCSSYNSGADCATSLPSYPTCDPFNGTCGIGENHFTCTKQYQCASGLFCDLDGSACGQGHCCDQNTSAVNNCTTGSSGANCYNGSDASTHGYQCASCYCKLCSWPLHNKCVTSSNTTCHDYPN